ncbi:hypothetical protein C1701_21505 [Actinoalloteichus sp. AHMU CJ021]|nr:hypothetical protein C1701_21505 [Actinoalloteichus sp. AHMU CJ021]
MRHRIAPHDVPERRLPVPAPGTDPAEDAWRHTGHHHLDQLSETLCALRAELPTLVRWGQRLAELLPAGHRLLAAGNGGSAAEAQHLTAELVGRFDGDRRAYSALALHAETSSVTAIGNDYGYGDVFARQVEAHARRGDVLLLLSTSGRSENLLRATGTARRLGVLTWAVTGALPNPLAGLADETLSLPGTCSSVQEAHLVAVHLLCVMFERALPATATAPRADAGNPRAPRPPSPPPTPAGPSQETASRHGSPAPDERVHAGTADTTAPARDPRPRRPTDGHLTGARRRGGAGDQAEAGARPFPPGTDHGARETGGGGQPRARRPRQGEGHRP